MNYIPINADRMALTDILKVVDTLTPFIINGKLKLSLILLDSTPFPKE